MIENREIINLPKVTETNSMSYWEPYSPAYKHLWSPPLCYTAFSSCWKRHLPSQKPTSPTLSSYLLCCCYFCFVPILVIPFKGAREILGPKLIFAAPNVFVKLCFIGTCIGNYHFFFFLLKTSKNQGDIIENFSGFSSSKPHCDLKGHGRW